LSSAPKVTDVALVVATESSFEVGLCFKLPVLVLAPVVEALGSAAKAWANRRALEALAQVRKNRQLACV
jgi:hypothetical protein